MIVEQQVRSAYSCTVSLSLPAKRCGPDHQAGCRAKRLAKETEREPTGLRASDPAPLLIETHEHLQLAATRWRADAANDLLTLPHHYDWHAANADVLADELRLREIALLYC